jgi:hypothetical protein
VFTFESRDLFGSDPNPISHEAFTVFSRYSGGAVRKQDYVGCPGQQRKRQPGFAGIDGDSFVPIFPAITVWTVVHARAIEFRDIRNRRQLVGDACRDQKLPREATNSALQFHFKPASDLSRIVRFHAPVLNSVLHDLVPRDSKEFARPYAIARQISVHSTGAAVARHAFIANENAPTAAAEEQRGAQSGGPSTDDDRVIHSAAGFGIRLMLHFHP